MNFPPGGLEEALISVPFSGRSEVASSTSYAYHNARRGRECFVIIQRSEEGVGTYRQGGREWRVPAGEAFIALVPEASEYFLRRADDGPWRFSWINFYGALSMELMRRVRAAHGPVLPMRAGDEAETAFDELVALAGKDGYERSCRAFDFVMKWLRELGRPQIDAEPVALAAARLMQCRFREPLSVKELAADFGLTREHFTRLFAAQHGVGPAEYLRDLRWDRARRLSREANLTQAELALRAGFPTVAALRRAAHKIGS